MGFTACRLKVIRHLFEKMFLGLKTTFRKWTGSASLLCCQYKRIASSAHLVLGRPGLNPAYVQACPRWSKFVDRTGSEGVDFNILCMRLTLLLLYAS